MKNLIKNTGIGRFGNGERLSHETLNKMNEGIDELIDILNLYLKSYVNINVEENNLSGSYTIEDALKMVPKERRVPGVRVAFRNNDDWTELLYIGSDPSIETNWNDLSNWKTNIKPIINGGEWFIKDSDHINNGD